MRQGLSIAMVAALVGSVAALASASTVRERRASAATAPAASLDWPRPEVLRAGLRAFECGRAAGYFSEPLLTIIDYSLPSTARRLWVVDLERRAVLFHELVAHGRNSGGNRTVAFSNRLGSKMSSLGLFRTAEAYVGQHGRALRLDGLEPGFNERARERAIVLHGAPYVGARAIAALRRLGRSWGCPAVRRDVARPLIDRIQGGTALFAYYPDADWTERSEFLRCDPPVPGVQLARDGTGRRTSAPARAPFRRSR